MSSIKKPALAQSSARWFSGLIAHPFVYSALAVLALGLMLVIVSAPLEMETQMLFCATCLGAALLLRRKASRLAILAMIVLSVVASLRYIYWRVTSSLGFEGPLDMFF